MISATAVINLKSREDFFFHILQSFIIPTKDMVTIEVVLEDPIFSKSLPSFSLNGQNRSKEQQLQQQKQHSQKTYHNDLPLIFAVVANRKAKQFYEQNADIKTFCPAVSLQNSKLEEEYKCFTDGGANVVSNLISKKIKDLLLDPKIQSLFHSFHLTDQNTKYVLGREEKELETDSKTKKEEHLKGQVGFPQRLLRLQLYLPSQADFVEEKDFAVIRELINLMIWGVIDLIFSSSFNLTSQIKEKNKSFRNKMKIKELEKLKKNDDKNQKQASKNMTFSDKEKKKKNRKN